MGIEEHFVIVHEPGLADRRDGLFEREKSGAFRKSENAHTAPDSAGRHDEHIHRPFSFQKRDFLNHRLHDAPVEALLSAEEGRANLDDKGLNVGRNGKQGCNAP